MTSTLTPLTDLDYKALFLDAVRMMAEIARAAGFDPNDPTVEPPAIVARVQNMRAERDALRADLAAERDALHDRIENALAEALSNPMMSIHDGDGPTAPDLESLIKLAGQIRRERTELRLTLAAERGDRKGAPSSDWEWGHDWRLGRSGWRHKSGRCVVTMKRNRKGIRWMTWWERERGSSWMVAPKERFDLARAAMIAANAALNGQG